ncbi:MAG: hypothetical protein ABR600_13530 [Actinomycetota bacterium]
MLEDVRRNMRGMLEAGVAAVSGALTPSRAREMARGIAEGGGRDQVNRVAQELMEWSQRSREWVTELVQREVKRQLASVGIATREDLDAIRKRVRELERSALKASGSKRAAPKRSAPQRSAPKGTPAATGLGDPGTGAI